MNRPINVFNGIIPHGFQQILSQRH